MFKAIIIGGTGATGKQLLIQLVKNQNCELVTPIESVSISWITTWKYNRWFIEKFSGKQRQI